jgi:hypothetical protein
MEMRLVAGPWSCQKEPNGAASARLPVSAGVTPYTRRAGAPSTGHATGRARSPSARSTSNSAPQALHANGY